MIFDFLFKPDIEKLKKKKDAKGLAKALRYKKDKKVRKDAAIILGDMGNLNAIQPLFATLKDEDENVRDNVVIALRKIVNRFGELNVFEWLTDHINYGKLNKLGIQKTSEDSIQLVFERTCGKCKKITIHRFYITKFILSYLNKSIYEHEFKYIKCGNCSINENFLIDEKIKNKINHITQNFFKFPEDATFIDLIELTKKIEKSKLDQNSIDMIKRIRNQVICENNTLCYYCGKEIHFGTGRRCSYCNLLVCTYHILPEMHGCRGNKSPSGDAIGYTTNGTWYPIR